MLWLALTALAAGAGLLVALPFLRTRQQPALATPVEVYKSQLDQVVREEAAGELDSAAAADLRVEIERRILDAPAASRSAPTSAKIDRVTAGAVAAIVILGSTVLYAATGDPDVSSVSRNSDGAIVNGQMQNLPDVDTMIERLRARLEATPDDAEGWRMLGWSYFETERYAQAVEAYRRATAIAPREAGYQSAYAEALTMANEGTVSLDARTAFRAVIALDARDERARFYLALAKAQGGDARGAIEDWLAALRDAPPNSQWAPRMRSEAEAAARRAGVNIAGRLPPPTIDRTVGAQAPALDPEVVARAQQASPEAREQMIADMVDGLEQRLAQNPHDADGWVRLMRSRMVLGQGDRARAALQNGLRAFRDDQAAQRGLRAAAAELNVPGS
jgi:cytochrome c-type biogenesis protein CcmH